MGLGGYLTWTAAAREIRKVSGDNVKVIPVEQHGSFLKIIKSPAFYNNPDFFFDMSSESNFIFPLILNNPSANYCKKDTKTKAFHRSDKHIIEQICECYGIKNPELKCFMNLTNDEKKWAKDFHNSKNLLGEKFIVVEPFSKENYTPNRKYPFEKWQSIINVLYKKIKIVQVGNKGNRVLDNVLDLTGKTSFRQAVSLIGLSELFLSTESGLVHAATSVNTKSVVIITGYQSEKMVSYPQNINVNISSHGPCGLKTPCLECKKDRDDHDWKNIVALVEEALCL